MLVQLGFIYRPILCISNQLQSVCIFLSFYYKFPYSILYGLTLIRVLNKNYLADQQKTAIDLLIL